MNTKQQLQQMRYSGLNNQDQWSLLNSNVPLSVLDQHNQAQDEIDTRASATRIATTLMNAVAKAAVPRTQAAVGKPTVSTSLQTNAQQRKLDMKQEEYETRFYEKAAARTNNTSKPTNPIKTPTTYKPVESNTQPNDSDGDNGKKETWIDKLATLWDNVVDFFTPEKSNPEIVTIATVPPIKTPRITQPPSPTPKPTPTLMPKPTANVDMISQFVTEQRDQRNPYYLKYSQDSGDRSDCSTQVFDFYEMKGDKNPLLGAQHETCKSYYEKLHIPTESFIDSGGTVWSTVPRDIAKGDLKVPDNWQSTTQFGDMVIWMKDPEYDSGKRLVINSYDDLHIGLCLGNEQMLDRAQWKENNPNGYEEGLFVRGLDTIKSSYKLILIISPGDEARLTPDDIYNYLLEHQD